MGVSTGRIRAAAVALLVLVAGALAACSGDDRDQARAAAKAFLDAWAAGNFGGAAQHTDAADTARAWLPEVQRQLDARAVAFTLGDTSADGDTATQRFRVSWTLPGYPKQPWSYDNRLPLRRSGDAWRVRWTPAVVHPKLDAASALKVERTLGARAALLDRAGQPLFTPTPVVTVGVEPRLVDDLPALAATLGRELDVTPADVIADVRKAAPTEFVPVITLRRPAYDAVKQRIHGLKGTVFRTGTRLLAPSRTFAQPFLGTVGEATREVLTESGGTYVAGDVLGTSGLQRRLNARLAGTPALAIRLTDQAGGARETLESRPGTPGRPVRLTLDRRVQAAAERALAGVAQMAAIVAVQPSTGDVLAVANSAAAPFDVALEGKYPPGSTFKVVTATALLARGVADPTSAVPCPATATVGGKTFQNADRFALGPAVPFRRAFARSCNTTFTTLGARLPAGALAEAASWYGIGAGWRTPVPTYSGAVPDTGDSGDSGDSVDRAAASIGQGQVLVSPFAMALAAATLRSGQAPAPAFVVGEPAPARQAPPALPTEAAATVRDFARAVVTEGTATALATAPGGPVSGKTGTAEYGNATPPRAHSWFVGYRGDLAFAVFVYDGDTAGRKAVPVAATFLAAAPALE